MVIRRYTSILGFLIFSVGITAQNDSTLFSILDSIVVTGYDSEQNLRSVPGAVHVLKEKQLDAFDNERILTSVNALPGIRFEQRSPGSYRVAIRGSTLRSPFGVRNIKVYWNGIPYTDPGGSTALNLLDNLNMRDIEIIKGPAGSVYGAGTGGVMNISSMSGNKDVGGITAGIQGGSFGFQKLFVQTDIVRNENTTSVKLARQSSNGYRDHTEFTRSVGELSGNYQLNNRHIIKSHLLFSNLDYQIPGGLTQSQYDENPRLARQPSRFALGSEESDAGIRQSLWLGGATHEFIYDQFQSQTTLYGSFSPFENPFNLDYKRDLRTSFGGRTRVDYYLDRLDDRMKISAGAEYQRGFNVARNFENDYGKPGALNFDDELKSVQFLMFGRLEYVFADSSFLTVGVSRNFLEYDINRLVDTYLDTSYQVVKRFDPVWIPRIGFSSMGEKLGWHASLSLGYSPPTIEDVRTNEGSINQNLKPEIGINYEAGLRGFLWNRMVSVDWTLFYFNLSNTIVQQSSPRGTVVFENSGSTDQYGMETLIEGVFRGGKRWSQVWQWHLSHSMHLFYFDDYSKLSGGEVRDYSGNELTGVPRHIVSGQIKWLPGNRWYLHAMVQAVGEIPLTDSNDIYSDAYQDVSAKAGYRFAFKNGLVSELFLGIRNLLDQKYSLGNDLNAFGGRYYQPAAPRNYYAGIKVGF